MLVDSISLKSHSRGHFEDRYRMAAFIFLCDSTTELECLDRSLFGSNPGEAHRFHYSKIAVGDTLFLYNLDLGTLRGPFAALTPCKMNIEPGAWKASRRKFPWQVRVDHTDCLENPLSANVVRALVPLAVTPVGLMPPHSLDDDQQASITEALRKRNT
jgi:hypothetical protein